MMKNSLKDVLHKICDYCRRHATKPVECEYVETALIQMPYAFKRCETIKVMDVMNHGKR